MPVKISLGILLGVATLAGVMLTITVLFAVIKLAVFKRRSPIYVISTAHMLCDLIQLLLCLLYLVPSIISDDWLFEGGQGSPVVGQLSTTFLFCWYYSSIAQVLMAINRLVVVCFPSSLIFSWKNVTISVIILCPVAIFMSWLSQYGLPCCKFTFDHEVLSYSYIFIDGVINYTNYYVDLPLNSASSATCAICYSYIFYFVWRMDHLYIKGAIGSGSRLKEYRYALQFCAISLFYLAAWVTFRIFPVLVGARGVEYFIIISLSVTINSSANAFVYITSNQEVKSVLYSTSLSTTVHHVSGHSRGIGGTSPRLPLTNRRHVCVVSAGT